MKIYRSLERVKGVGRGSVVAVGVFDGVHRGHLRVIKRLKETAGKRGFPSVIVTFYPHPYSVLRPGRPVPLLSSLDHRLRLLKEQGVDITVIMPFDRSLSRMGPEDFAWRVLARRLNAKEIIATPNFTIGSAREGDLRLLKKIAERHDIRISVTGLLKIGGRVVSSTGIRELITKGRLREAARRLGRPVSIQGTVGRGRKRGRILGFPTANIDPHHEAIPPSGVYVVKVKFIKGRRAYGGVCNIGFRPTYQPSADPLYPLEPSIEAHMFNFRRDIYGKKLEIFFLKRLRPERRFGDEDALRRRINLDRRVAADYLRRSGF